jgi:hypothetical protein
MMRLRCSSRDVSNLWTIQPTILEVLILVIIKGKGVVGNNSQRDHSSTSSDVDVLKELPCASSTSLASIAVGTDTAAHHLVLVVEQRLVTFFSPHIVLTNQQELNLEVVAEQQKYVSKTARPRTRKVNPPTTSIAMYSPVPTSLAQKIVS